MKKLRGYSLIELAIVLFVVTILISAGLSALNVQVTNSAISTTTKKQALLKDALAGYLVRNKRLPCPDTDFGAPDGMENRTTPGDATTPCSSRFGILPYIDLGLARTDALDAWENFFSYAVSTTNSIGPPPIRNDWTRSANFATGNGGDFTVNDRSTTTYGVIQIATNVVAVIISYGKNGSGARTIKGTQNANPALGTDEATNTLAGTIYYKRPISNVPLGTSGDFDDLVVYLTADDLLAQAVRDGSMLSFQAQTQKAFTDAQNRIIGYVITTCYLPTLATLTASEPLPSDGWGSPLNYAPTDTTTKIPAMAGTNAYTLWSSGLDKTSPSADDVHRDMLLTILKSMLTTPFLLAAPCI